MRKKNKNQGLPDLNPQYVRKSRTTLFKASK